MAVTDDDNSTQRPVVRLESKNELEAIHMEDAAQCWSVGSASVC